jgi:hypothetical protein
MAIETDKCNASKNIKIEWVMRTHEIYLSFDFESWTHKWFTKQNNKNVELGMAFKKDHLETHTKYLNKKNIPYIIQGFFKSICKLWRFINLSYIRKSQSATITASPTIHSQLFLHKCQTEIRLFNFFLLCNK